MQDEDVDLILVRVPAHITVSAQVTLGEVLRRGPTERLAAVRIFVSRLDALARADELHRRGGSDESVQIQRPIEDGAVVQVSPQRNVAWRQMPSVVLALDF